MKRKFFSVVVAACAALFSFSGLTGCSGGGAEESETYGLITLREFQSCAKAFHLNLGGTIPLTIVPQSEVQVQGGNVGDDTYATGRVIMQCLVNGYGATVTYSISGWTNGVPADGAATEAGTAATTGLLIQFAPDEAGTVVSSPDVLLALGANPANDKLVSDIKVGLQFSHMSCDSEFKISYVKDSETKTETKTNSGAFFVYKVS